ncbi:hypothetical protein [Acidovorax sp. CCYZU-2555]|uniref:hypothetical protein n=1 Tax=Acidovorax sp. CCYZU-2555 TaxID=2835042 RepID=UPI001BCC6EE5|nr:hypothetical protein [Acidovorax sp. CCYZU-2555]MBS7779271.1 hypothetical protein [Acidovorax sp. CCYZU-2555]
MISSSACESLDRMFVHSLQNTFFTLSGERAEVTQVAQSAPDSGSQMVVLMIAAHTFRLVMALHFPKAADAMRFLAPDSQGDDAGPQAFRDLMSERGNMCCGMVNREIGRFFAHTGMSTPHIIDSRSGPFMTALPHAYATHWRIAVDAQLHIDASLCIHNRAPMDFEWHADAQEEVTGELEFF